MRHFISRIVGALAAGGGTAIVTDTDMGIAVALATLAYALVHRAVSYVIDPKDQAKGA
jgi:hypothetical protein